MKVTCEINDYSNPEKTPIRVHNAWSDSKCVELEVDGERYKVNAQELISAIQRANVDCFGM